MRLFVALQIPEDVRSNCAALIRDLRETAPKLKWVRAENLHITLKFIGHVPDEKLNGISHALSRVRSPEPLQTQFRGLGFFPNEKRPRVFWMGIDAPRNLSELTARIDAELHALGFPLETRAFSPHLTLARIDESHKRLPDAFRSRVQEHATRDFGNLRATEFALVESKLKPSGAEYTTVRAYRFTDPLSEPIRDAR